jgi:hypothetical protein
MRIAPSGINKDTVLALLGAEWEQPVKRRKDAVEHDGRMLYRCGRPNGNKALPAVLMHRIFGSFLEYIKARGCTWCVAVHASVSLHAVLEEVLNSWRNGLGRARQTSYDT